MSKMGSIACGIMMLLLCSLASAQLTIDATGAQKESKNASGGHVYEMGLKLPVSVSIELASTSEDGKAILEFTLTNNGNKGLRLPVSTDPEEVERSSSGAKYSFWLLGLYLTADARREKRVPGGASLYGSEDSATLITLAPGDSIRVRAKVGIPSTSVGPQGRSAVYIAHAVLTTETVTTAGGRLFRDSMDAGHAESREYTVEELLKLPSVH